MVMENPEVDTLVQEPGQFQQEKHQTYNTLFQERGNTFVHWTKKSKSPLNFQRSFRYILG